MLCGLRKRFITLLQARYKLLTFLQKDYLRRISVKMLSIRTAPQNTAANVSPSNSVDTDAISTDPASHSVHSEVLEQEQSPLAPLAPLANQSLAHQEPLSQNLHRYQITKHVWHFTKLGNGVSGTRGIFQ